MLKQSLIMMLSAVSLINTSQFTQINMVADNYCTIPATVTVCNTDDNIIQLTDADGGTWIVEDITGYHIDDSCTMILSDNDDIIAVVK